MYLLPYKLEKISLNPPVWRVWVFMTAGGKQLWEVDPEDSEKSPETLVQEYCIENGFVGSLQCHSTGGHCCQEPQSLRPEGALKTSALDGSVKKATPDTIVFEVETLGTSFYTFIDFLEKNQSAPESCEVWRPFFWIGEKPGEQDEYEWYPACQKVSLGKFGTLDKLWLVLRELAIEK